jgi:hypothetical protein
VFAPRTCIGSFIEKSTETITEDVPNLDTHFQLKYAFLRKNYFMGA